MEVEQNWLSRFMRNYGIRPYSFRGNLRHPIQTMRYQWYCFYFGVGNIIRFWRAVWHFDTCDYSGLMDLMRVATKTMAIHHRNHGHCVGSDRTAHQLRVVSELCKRLRDDDYAELAGHSRYEQMSEGGTASMGQTSWDTWQTGR
jgi:hypothetical protein